MTRRLIGLFIAVISIFGVNFIPLELILNRGFSAKGAMLLYLAENVFAITISSTIVYVFAPRIENGDKHRIRRETIINFIVPAGFTTIITGILLAAFVFMILRARFSLDVFFESLIWMVGFQIIEFIGALVMMSPFSLRQAETFLNRTLGRVILLMLCVLLGVFCAAWINEWFVIPFIALKSIVDIGEQFKIFRDVRVFLNARALV